MTLALIYAKIEGSFKNRSDVPVYQGRDINFVNERKRKTMPMINMGEYIKQELEKDKHRKKTIISTRPWQYNTVFTQTDMHLIALLYYWGKIVLILDRRFRYKAISTIAGKINTTEGDIEDSLSRLCAWGLARYKDYENNDPVEKEIRIYPTDQLIEAMENDSDGYELVEKIKQLEAEKREWRSTKKPKKQSNKKEA